MTQLTLNIPIDQFNQFWKEGCAELCSVHDILNRQSSPMQHTLYEPLISKYQTWLDGGKEYELVRKGCQRLSNRKAGEELMSISKALNENRPPRKLQTLANKDSE